MLVGTVIGAAAVLALVAAAWYVYRHATPSQPNLKRMELYVRRKGDDRSIKGWPLVADGEQHSVLALDPLRPDDDFNLTAEFREPTYWYLVWFDTAGAVEVSGPLDHKAVSMQYPSDDAFVSVNPADPEGMHLLVLVASSKRMNPQDITDRLRGVEKPAELLPADSPEVRGSGAIRKSNALSARTFLKDMEQKLPAGLTPLHVVQLPTKK